MYGCRYHWCYCDFFICGADIAFVHNAAWICVWISMLSQWLQCVKGRYCSFYDVFLICECRCRCSCNNSDILRDACSLILADLVSPLADTIVFVMNLVFFAGLGKLSYNPWILDNHYCKPLSVLLFRGASLVFCDAVFLQVFPFEIKTKPRALLSCMSVRMLCVCFQAEPWAAALRFGFT